MREIINLIITELRGSWRFRWPAMLVTWILCMSGWAFVYLMPDVYESRATILFDTSSSDLGKLLKSMTVNTDILSRVEAVRTVMLGRPHLEKIALETDLHLRAGSEIEMGNVISGLQSQISITRARQQGANLYRISFRDVEPETAHAVVDTLLNTFVERTLVANQAGSQQAQKFLREQLEELEVVLTAAEDRVAEFKRENVGKIPAESGDYFARLESQMNALESTQAELRQANRRRDSLRQQLAGDKPNIDGVGVKSEIDLRIAENQRRLEELQLRFTDLHPDVIAVEEALKQLHQQKENQSDVLQEFDDVGIPSDNPVIQNIQIELSNINAEIASREEKEATHRRKIAELEDLVDVLPQIEAQLGRLNRDYSVKLAQYRSLLQKLEVAELSESAEQSEKVKFRVIDPPLIPLEPAAPDRPKLLVLVLLAGIAAGGGFAFLGNQLKPVFMDPNLIREVTGLPVLGTILVMNTGTRHRRQIGQITAFGSALTALCLLFGVVIWFHHTGSLLFRSII